MGQVFSVKIFLDLEGVLNKARIHTLIIELHDPILSDADCTITLRSIPI